MRAHLSLSDWITANGGIAHRQAALAAGFTIATQRAAVRAEQVDRLRRSWLATAAAPPDLRAAALSGGRLACVSAARRRRWWMPETAPTELHLHVDPHGASPVTARTGTDGAAMIHWTRTIAPPPGHGLLESVEDTLAHLAVCLSPEDALVVWESAVRSERLDVEALRRVRWSSLPARACADAVRGLSDSGLETIFVTRLSHWQITIVHQVMIAGHHVDFLIGDRLAVQVDGYAFHSSATQRSRDVALDAELTLRGYTVLRFTYAQVVHDWPAVERVLARAVAMGAHLA